MPKATQSMESRQLQQHNVAIQERLGRHDEQIDSLANSLSEHARTTAQRFDHVEKKIDEGFSELTRKFAYGSRFNWQGASVIMTAVLTLVGLGYFVLDSQMTHNRAMLEVQLSTRNEIESIRRDSLDKVRAAERRADDAKTSSILQRQALLWGKIFPDLHLPDSTFQP